jgi:hypothetical protein
MGTPRLPVIATPGDGGRHDYVAQVDHEAGARLHTLHCELPTYLPIFFKVERAIKEGRVGSYCE